MDAMRKRLASFLSRGRSPRRRAAWKLIPACDPLEGRRLLSATARASAKAKATAAATTTLPTAGSTTRDENGTTFAADLQTLQIDLNAVIADVQADVYYAHALQADIQAIQAEATATPSPAVKSAFIAQIQGAEDGFASAAQVKAFNASFKAFLQGEGITDSALIAKTMDDQQALSRTLEVPQADTLRVILDRRALANDLGFGAEKYSTITDAGPSTKAAKAVTAKALKSLVPPGSPKAATAKAATAKAAKAGQAKLAGR